MAGRPYPKDWERKLRVMQQLHARRMGVTELAREIDVCQSHVSEIIWGTRKSPIGETRIAAFFGMSREELFPKKRGSKAEGAAA